MRLAYCTTLRLPSERAYAHQVASVVNVLAELGVEVDVFAPKRRNTVKDDFWTYHGVTRDVRLTHLSVIDGIALLPGVLGLWVLNWSYKRSLCRALSKWQGDILYTRNPTLLPLLLSVGKPVVIELHTLPRYGRRAFARRCAQCKLVACLTRPMRDELAMLGVPEDRLIVEGDAVDVGRFAGMPERRTARVEYDVPPDAFVVAYAGSLETMGLSKGVDQLVGAMEELHVRFPQLFMLIAGGPPSAAENLRQLVVRRGLPHKINVLGPVPFLKVPTIYAAANVLVYTAPAADEPYFRRDTSPLKLFEYMAAGRPIITADLAPIRDVLDESSALFYQPGDVKNLASAIAFAIEHPGEMKDRAAKALERVQEHTWDKRMKRILSAIR